MCLVRPLRLYASPEPLQHLPIYSRIFKKSRKGASEDGTPMRIAVPPHDATTVTSHLRVLRVYFLTESH